VLVETATGVNYKKVTLTVLVLVVATIDTALAALHTACNPVWFCHEWCEGYLQGRSSVVILWLYTQAPESRGRGDLWRRSRKAKTENGRALPKAASNKMAGELVAAILSSNSPAGEAGLTGVGSSRAKTWWY